jgi:hypothetical protein
MSTHIDGSSDVDAKTADFVAQTAPTDAQNACRLDLVAASVPEDADYDLAFHPFQAFRVKILGIPSDPFANELIPIERTCWQYLLAHWFGVRASESAAYYLC